MPSPAGDVMAAFVLDRFGGPEVLQWREHPLRAPRAGEIRVAVKACGVCRHDVLTREGAFPSIELPIVLGHQIAGVVESVGPDAEDLVVGDRVMSLAFQTCGRCEMCTSGRETLCRRRPQFLGEDIDGGYAEYVVTSARSWLHLPPELDFAAGAILTCTLGTAFHAITGRARAEAGETAVVTGASGGVGRHALQLLRAFGLRVIAVSRSLEHDEELHASGADEVVRSDDGSYARPVKKLTDGLGADFVIDIVGGPSLLDAIHCVRPGGRIVVLGNVEGQSVLLKPAQLILKEISLIGTKSISRHEMERLLSLVARGVVQPDAARPVPMSEAVDVHEQMRHGGGPRTVLTL